MNLTVIFGFIAAYFLAILGTVVFWRLKTHGKIIPSLEEFFLAKRSLSTPVLVATFLGTLFSAATAVAFSGGTYAGGVGMVLYISTAIMLSPIVIATYGKALRAYTGKHGLMSPIEAIGHAYNSRTLQVVVALFFCVVIIPFLSLQLVGLGKVIEGLSGGQITYLQGVGTAIGIILVYLIFGGMRAVSYTDMVQFGLIVLGLVLGAYVFITHNWGSITAFSAAAVAQVPAHTTLPGPTGKYTFQFIFGQALVITMWYVFPQFGCRYMMLRDDKQLKVLSICGGLAPFIVCVPPLIFGLGGVMLYPELAQSNQLMGHIIAQLNETQILGKIAGGLLVIGILGAAMSTTDSVLLSIGQMFARDVVRPAAEISHKAQIIIAKVVMVLVLAAAFVIGMNPPAIMFDLALQTIELGACAAPLLLGFRWKYRSVLGAYACTLVGLGVYTALNVNGIMPLGFTASFAGFIASCAVFLAVGYVRKAQGKIHPQPNYQLSRPPMQTNT